MTSEPVQIQIKQQMSKVHIYKRNKTKKNNTLNQHATVSYLKSKHVTT